MDPQPSAIILIWAARIPFGELRCLTWQVGSQWRVGIYDDQETYAQVLAPNVGAVCRWAMMARRELDRLGLGGRPGFDPDIDVTIDAPNTVDQAAFDQAAFDQIVDDCITCTDARARRH